MIEIMFRPMERCPGHKTIGKNCNARASHQKAMSLLRYELQRIAATDVVLEAGFAASQIRNDGYPYSNARPTHSTVRITFRREGNTPMAMTCGGWAEWHLNVYMIAKTLESLRAVERYGCTSGGQQYAGWAKLPPGASGSGPAATPHQAAEWVTVEDAMRFLSRVADGDLHSTLAKDLDAIYRAAALKAHPDKGGSAELMGKVNRAREFVRRVTGGAS
jgi:hypothetical protein